MILIMAGQSCPTQSIGRVVVLVTYHSHEILYTHIKILSGGGILLIKKKTSK